MTAQERDYIHEIYINLHPKLLKIASSYSYAQAEDVVQETFQIACAKPDALLDADDPEMWLIRTVRNVIRNKQHMDIRWNKILVAVDECTMEEAASYPLERDLHLPQHIPGIEDGDLELFYRIALHGVEISDEAKRLNITNWACRKRYQRAKKRLAKACSEENF